MDILIPLEHIQQKILLVRGRKVLLDRDIAALYGVKTEVLNQAVKRNSARFPSDFLFQLTKTELEALSSHFGTSENNYGGQRYLPLAFTEQGVAMLSGVLRSKRAIMVNIQIMRTFTQLRELIASHQDLALRLDALESRYDKQFSMVFEAIRELIQPPEEPREEIGFKDPSASSG